ncbi:MAG: SOS response-associated peptidase, partial [Halobacteriovoraceae bacterium]|nr:SOS response-associated peptidase [Halobacteriovoraceae bacterium]
MCGRAYFTFTEELEMRAFDRNPLRLDFENNYNLAPTEDIPLLSFDSNQNNFKLELGYWWLMPPWVKKIDPKKAGYTFNARGETFLQKNGFKESALKRRCEVILSGFIEWRYLNKKEKQPYVIRHADKSPVTLAGIYSICDGRKTVSIVTVKANKLMRDIHNRWRFDKNKEPRMPLILTDADRVKWHDATFNNSDTLQKLIDSYHESNNFHL